MKFTPADIKQLLAANKAEPTKRLGQNFLVDEGVLKKIIETSEPQLTDLIIEIGPGLGVLTLALAPLVKKIIAIEKDPALSNLLAEALVKEKIKNVEIITQDVLKFDPPTTSYKLIANIPYYITSPIIRKFLETQ